MLSFYQDIPQYLNPIAFSIGFLNIRWYSLTYLVGLIIVAGLLRWRISKKETYLKYSDVLDFLIYSFVGVLAGGRIGYVFIYNWEYYRQHLLNIFYPIDMNGNFVGLYGMSYHGAIIGFSLTAYLFCRKRRINFLRILDFVIPAIPAGYFFGRIGNFLNGELYGRTTDSYWGMFFNNEKHLRHPSQLYEAFFEGIVLFAILWVLRNKFSKKQGVLTGLYVFSYGIVRFFLEFFRQPDPQLGFVISFFTIGQILSLFMIIIGLVIICGNNCQRGIAK